MNKEFNKKKTLIVSYLPSGQNSNTKQILDHFIAETRKANSHVEILDLLKTSIPDFTEESMAAYYTRNFMGKELNASQLKAISEMDKFSKQFKSADIIVLAFPMHNFSYPGIVKSYIDAVMLKGVVYDYTASGFTGLMNGKRAICIYTAAGAYDGDRSAWDMCGSLFQNQCKFMGFDEAKIIKAFYTAQADKKEETIRSANNQVSDIIKSWY